MQYQCKCCETYADPGPGAAGAPNNEVINQEDYGEGIHKQYLSQYIAYDHTLPRTDKIPCINKTCQRPESSKEEVIYLKYDSINMKFLYYCSHCGMFWKTM